jgi:hypothetical protein
VGGVQRVEDVPQRDAKNVAVGRQQRDDDVVDDEVRQAAAADMTATTASQSPTPWRALRRNAATPDCFAGKSRRTVMHPVVRIKTDRKNRLDKTICR